MTYATRNRGKRVDLQGLVKSHYVYDDKVKQAFKTEDFDEKPVGEHYGTSLNCGPDLSKD